MAVDREAVIVFPSTHHMLRAEALLKEEGFRLRLVPAPPQAGELCTTAIALPGDEGEAAAGFLEKKGVLIKAVLHPEKAETDAVADILRSYASEASAFPGIGNVLVKISTKNELEREDIAALVRPGPGEELVRRAAEDLARTLSGGWMTAAAVLRIAGRRDRSGPDGDTVGHYGDVDADLGRMEETVREMSSLGLVHLVLDLGEMDGLPWEAGDFRRVLGEGIVVVVYADRLPGLAGELVRDFGVRQVLLRRDDLFRLDLGELADEMVFLRDNRPGPVGSGNLVPLLPREEVTEEERDRLCLAVAILRLVLGDAFLPLPRALWRDGDLCGGNFLILEGTTGGLEESVREAERVLSPRGWTLKRAGRK
ncbi:MAG: DUF3343 domain-containing protein [Actinobacteria bacterium]|nr:DUF3343 domain-containing protein [Actinomycetota bacterium]